MFLISLKLVSKVSVEFMLKTLKCIHCLKNSSNFFAELKELNQFVKTIFYVKVSFHHSFSFQTNQSKSLKDIYKEVHESQEKRLHFFLSIIHAMKLLLAMYIAYVLLT